MIIYGDPNQFGGFQNMLQRYIIYKLSKNKNDMIKNCELFFKNDMIDQKNIQIEQEKR